jgi:X-Pro dipeptidyl-peptidase
MVRRGWVVAGLVGLLSGVLAVPAAAEPAFVVANGVTQPVHALADAVRETVWVDIGLDLDGNGVGDRSSTPARTTRPRGGATKASASPTTRPGCR